MNTLTIEALNAQQAMVLMEVEERIEDDAVSVSRALNMSAGRLVQIATDLHKKGLLVIRQMGGELYLSLSKKGKRLYSTLWPGQLYFG